MMRVLLLVLPAVLGHLRSDESELAEAREHLQKTRDAYATFLKKQIEMVGVHKKGIHIEVEEAEKRVEAANEELRKARESYAETNASTESNPTPLESAVMSRDKRAKETFEAFRNEAVTALEFLNAKYDLAHLKKEYSSYVTTTAPQMTKPSSGEVTSAEYDRLRDEATSAIKAYKAEVAPATTTTAPQTTKPSSGEVTSAEYDRLRNEATSAIKAYKAEVAPATVDKHTTLEALRAEASAALATEKRKQSFIGLLSPSSVMVPDMEKMTPHEAIVWLKSDAASAVREYNTVKAAAAASRAAATKLGRAGNLNSVNQLSRMKGEEHKDSDKKLISDYLADQAENTKDEKTKKVLQDLSSELKQTGSAVSSKKQVDDKDNNAYQGSPFGTGVVIGGSLGIVAAVVITQMGLLKTV